LVITLIAIVGLLPALGGGSPFSSLSGIGAFVVLVALSTLSQVSSHLSSVLLTADFIPQIFKNGRLTGANTAVRRIDLLTEALSPMLAGYLLARFPWEPFAFSGFVIIALWNLASFIAENLVLRQERRHLHPTGAQSPWSRFRTDIALFRSQTAFLTMLGLACMHITVLSGPSVVGTAFLKAGWNISEDVIGLFRGAAALMSISSTVFLLASTAALFSSLQTVFVFLAACAFMFGRDAAFFYLALIVLSRFGHSGFVLCEMQVRQETVPLAQLGLINGIAVSLKCNRRADHLSARSDIRGSRGVPIAGLDLGSGYPRLHAARQLLVMLRQGGSARHTGTALPAAAADTIKHAALYTTRTRSGLARMRIQLLRKLVNGHRSFMSHELVPPYIVLV
jgi:hypothetical protein